MQPAIETLRQSMDRVDLLGGLHTALSAMTTPVVDKSDLLRAQLVLAVSALDQYVHAITLRGMLDVFEAKRGPTDSYLKFKITMGAFVSAGPPVGHAWFESEILERHSHTSFQQPDKIAGAIGLFTDVDIWGQVALRMATTKKDVRARLKLIVDRRNKIAHEADLDPSYPNTRWPIHEVDVAESARFLRGLGESLHAVLS